MKRILIPLLCVLFSVSAAYGQFAVDMGNESNPASGDTTVQAKEPFRLRTYFTALAGKDTLKIGRAFSGAVVLPGYAQAYNRQYGKSRSIAGMGQAFTWVTTFKSNIRNGKQFLRVVQELVLCGSGIVLLGIC